jgi:BirA family biotin operon repressor/biotin-[acetyl-CoA-carboxylase] ligase
MKTLSVENPFGAPIYHEETLSSTMDTARFLASRNEAHGTVICADFQEAGRGRQNRPWLINRGENLLFTVLLCYGNSMTMPQALTLRTGLAVSLAIEDFAPVLAGLVKVKWPNDIMIKSRDSETARKVAGILAESDGKNVYIGIGVNFYQKEFSGDLRSKAVGLASFVPELNRKNYFAKDTCLSGDARFLLLEKILLRLYNEIEASGSKLPAENQVGDLASIHETCSWQARLSQRLYKKGEIVSFAEGAAGSKQIVSGVLSGIGPGGELLIVPNGETKERSFVTGELLVYA